MKPRTSHFGRLLLPAALISFSGYAHAASGTWLGTTDATWAGANWSAAPSPGSTETATFNGAGGGNTTIDLGGGVTIGTVIFDTATAAGYTIGSGGVGAQILTFDNTGAVTMNSTVANNQLFNANLVLGTAAVGTTTVTNSSTTKSLTFAGSITGGTGGTAGAKTLTIAGAGAVNFTGAFGAGGSTGIILSNTGTGTTTLSGSATSSLRGFGATANLGKAIVDGQAVTVTAATNIGAGGSTIQLKTGSLSYNAGVDSSGSSDCGLLLVSGGTFSASSVQVRRAGNPTAGAAVSSTAGFVVTGGNASITGMFTVGAANSGATSLVNGGALSVGGEVRIGSGINNSSRYSILEVRSGSLTATDATNGIILSRSSTMIGNNSQLLLTGGTTTAEKITFGTASTLTGSTGNVTLNGASAFLYLGSGGFVNGSANITPSITLTSGTLAAKADWSSLMNMSLSGSGVTIKAADAADVSRNITLRGVISGSNGFTKTGGGTLALENDNSFSGTLTANAGTTRIDHSLAAKSATVSIGAANAVAFGTVITAATFGGLSGAGGLVLTNTDTNAVALKVGNNNANTSYSGALSGAGSIEKIGNGVLTVTNTSNAVAFTVSAGTLTGGVTTSSNGGFGTGTITFKGGTISSSMGGNNTLSLGNSIEVGTGDTGTFNTPNRLSWTGSVSGAGTLNIGVTTTVSRFDLQNNWTGFTGTANFTGSGGIRLMNNPGTFNANSFQSTALNLGGSVGFQPVTNSGGNTYLIGSLSGSSATASLGGGTAGAATYSVGGLDTSTSFAGAISGNAALTKTGTGTLTLSGTNNYTGTTIITSGTLKLDATGTIDSSTHINVGNTGSLGAVLDVSAKTGGFTIGSTQKLSGIGTVDANDAGTLRTVNIAGTHAVGNSPGLQTVDGNLAYASGSIFEWDLAANKDTDGLDDSIGATTDNGIAGTNYDAVTVTGTLNIASDAVFKVIQNAGADFSNPFWTNNQSWSNIFIVTGAVTSGWSNTAVSVYDTFNVLQDVSIYGSFSITGSTLTWSAVPEPTSALAGLLITAGLLRRRRN